MCVRVRVRARGLHNHLIVYVFAGADTGGSSRGALDPPKFFSIPRSRYSNRAVALIKQSQYQSSV